MLFAIGPARAGTLPAASTFVQCFADGNNSFHATECNQGGFPGVPPSATAVATLAPIASVSVEVTAPPTTVLGAGASATASYRFQVSGGNPGDLVPILVDFSLTAESTPASSASAKLIIHSSGLASSPHVEELICDPQGCDDTSLSETVTIQAQSGSTTDSVILYAQAQAPPTGVSNESASALADPYISIDPAFPDASLYSIVVSPGVGNVPVPEPANEGLAGAALGALGLAARRGIQRRPRG